MHIKIKYILALIVALIFFVYYGKTKQTDFYMINGNCLLHIYESKFTSICRVAVVNEEEKVFFMIPSSTSVNMLKMEYIARDKSVRVIFNLNLLNNDGGFFENLSYFTIKNSTKIEDITFQCNFLLFPEQRICYKKKVIFYYSTNYGSIVPRPISISIEDEHSMSVIFK